MTVPAGFVYTELMPRGGDLGGCPSLGGWVKSLGPPPLIITAWVGGSAVYGPFFTYNYDYCLGGWAQSNFEKHFHRSVCTGCLSSGVSVTVSDPTVRAVVWHINAADSIPTGNIRIINLGMVTMMEKKILHK